MIEHLFGTPTISTPIDCALGLVVVVSVGLAAWTIYRNWDK